MAIASWFGAASSDPSACPSSMVFVDAGAFVMGSNAKERRGEYKVTDGRAWQWCVLPDGEVFHVHAMTVCRGVLYAATSAWRAGLQRSDDGGSTWRIVYEHPGPPRSVTRITTLAVNRDVLYAGLTASEDGVKLLRMQENTLCPVHGWPKGLMVDVLASHRGWLYGVNADAHGRSLWRTDGRTTERISALSRETVRGLIGNAHPVARMRSSTPKPSSLGMPRSRSKSADRLRSMAASVLPVADGFDLVPGVGQDIFKDGAVIHVVISEHDTVSNACSLVGEGDHLGAAVTSPSS